MNAYMQGVRMTTVQITLPDGLAQEAAQAGLLTPEKIEHILRERLRQERVERLKAARAVLAADPLPPMTPQEISAEVDAYRSEQRRAAGS
ncbi:MAG TPA: hypothetical protein VLJ58_13965 [Ramlibacter sp.]|nr:hypothetical protein [Ramlibacter sp.]